MAPLLTLSVQQILHGLWDELGRTQGALMDPPRAEPPEAAEAAAAANAQQAQRNDICR